MMGRRFIAALPMYDWPERRAEVDAEWQEMRAGLLEAGFDPPQSLTRRNGDLPPVPGGIRDAQGQVIAPDPATLPENELDLPTLWRHPDLLFCQTCWGPMELGLARHVTVVGQADYTGIEGGDGVFYSSALVMTRSPIAQDHHVAAPTGMQSLFSPDLLRGKCLAYNSRDSMSGWTGLQRDLQNAGQDTDLFGSLLETGSHRASICAVAAGQADVAAVDARSWQLAQRFEPASDALVVIGWTSRRTGLPFIRARNIG
jgi:ABC-type phosphate/phosphonate transport system substrate-binding protein